MRKQTGVCGKGMSSPLLDITLCKEASSLLLDITLSSHVLIQGW